MGDVPIIIPSNQVQSVSGSVVLQDTTGAPANAPTNYASGTILRGEIIGRDAQGNAILRTQQGTDVPIKTDTLLKYGNQVVIRIDASGGAVNARILSIDGQSPPPTTPSPPLNPDDVVDSVTTNSIKTNVSLANTLETENTNIPKGSANADSLLIRAVLLSRSPTTDSILQNLPAGTSPPSEPLQAGSQVILKLIPQTAGQSALPNAQTATNSQTIQSNFQNSVGTQQKTITPQSSNQISSSNFGQTASSSSQPINNTPPTLVSAVNSPNVSSTQSNVLPSTAQVVPSVGQPAQGSLPSTLPVSPSVSSTVPLNTSVTPSANSQPPASVSSPSTNQYVPQTQTTANISNQTSPQNVAVNNQQQYAAYAKQADGIPNRMFSNIPSSSPNISFPTTPSGQLSGILMSTSQSGDVIAQTPLGVIRMPIGAFGGTKLEPGMPLLFSISGFKPATSSTMTALGGALPSQPYSELANSWQSIEDIVAIVRAANPQAAAELVNRLPQTGSKMTSSMLFFVSAIVGGDVGKLLGQRVMNTLEQQGRGDLIRKLGSEMAVIKQGFVEQPSQNWQLMYFPMLHEQELHSVRMYLKKDDKDKEQKKKKNGDTRFIIEVDMTALGPMQLDGFVKKNDRNIRFDLILRTLMPMAAEDEKAILGIYNSAAQIAGFSGSFDIQTVRDFPVKPMEEILTNQNGSIVV